MRRLSTIAAQSSLIALAVAAIVIGGRAWWQHEPVAQPETVSIQPGRMLYRLPGEYTRNDQPADAPEQLLGFQYGLEIMKYQVSGADYTHCVAAKACKQADGGRGSMDRPVTGVDHQDAMDYASWLSRQTGERWRLPTDAEWTFAAAERFTEKPLGLNEDGSNPAARWLERYRRESANAVPDPEPKPQGFFGMNSKGVADVSGNVWDWTSTCYVRAAIDKPGQAVENCGVRVAAGKHRAYMSFFIRDGKSGGCAAGMAPHNLGIRLVHEKPSFLIRLISLFVV
ncbi:MAG: SUMF1/EgtB/PvdO family nonheme iron enzyme [Mesorhizobium sp.]